MSIITLPAVRLPTKLDVVREAYVEGRIDLDRFEKCVEHLLRTGKADAHPSLQRPRGL